MGLTGELTGAAATLGVSADAGLAKTLPIYLDLRFV
jgi:hypothetical protein